MVYCRPGDLAGLATVGNGVEIKKSTIPNSGNGLFATRAFQPKQIITEYCGPIISREEAVHIRQTDPSAISHFRSLGYHQVISGYRHKEEAVGKGGASFANDATKLRRNNAKLCVFEMRYTHQLRVFLVAEKAIAPGEEVFAAYGKDYWKIKPAKTEAAASGSFTDVGRGQRRLTQFNGFASSKAGVSLQGASKAAAGVTRSSAGSGLAASGIPLTLS